MGGSWGKGLERCSFGSDGQSGKQRASFFLIPSQSSFLSLGVQLCRREFLCCSGHLPPISAPLLLSVVHGHASSAKLAALVSAGSALAKGPMLLTAEFIKAKERSVGDYNRDYRL